MMRSIRPPESKQATTLLVAVRCRPLTPREQARSRDILRVVDDKVVIVLDPDVSKDYLDRVQNRSKEKQYAFDVAFGPESTNKDVYEKTIGSMVEGVIQGLNATVFAYGATGSGKTHTMAGIEGDPGLMVLSLQKIFSLIANEESKHEFVVTCSYLEVYNEVIYDLLEKSSGHLELREDPDQGITVAGLKRIQVNSAEKILELLNQGNNRRKTESTNANATSSRSHAVLEITVKRKQRNHYRSQVLHGKLALVDLAGSERASETNNAGQKLRDGANINKSLLALANCINALGKQQKKGLAYVPYRNSKLTRLLKDGLSGNSRTVMVATVSSGADQYHHTTNTLKYADRAKEIKTHIQTNVGTVDAHVADYQRMIDNLQVEVSQLRRELADKETILNLRTPEKTSDDELSWLDALSHDINENVEERVNLQKALFELEDMNMRNRAELQQLDELIAEQQIYDGESETLNELVEHRQVVLDNIRDNDEAGAHYRQDIELNEAQRKELQQQIDDAISSNRNQTYLRILSQYRLLGMTNMELQFQMAIRDQIIQGQREALDNMWRLLESVGLNDKQILEAASQQGILIEGGIMPSLMSARSHLPLGTIGVSRNMPKKAGSARLSNLIQVPVSLDSEAEAESRVSKRYINSFEVKETSYSDTINFERTLPNFGDKEGIAQVKEMAKSAAPRIHQAFSAEPYSQAILHSCNTTQASPVISNFGHQHSKENETIVGTSKSFAGSELPKECIHHDFSNQKEWTPTKRIRWPPSAEHHFQERPQEPSDDIADGMDDRSEMNEATQCSCKTSGIHLLKAKSKQLTENDLLQKELLRLDTELQDLKRGLDRSPPTQAYSCGRTYSAFTHFEPKSTPRNGLGPLRSNSEAFIMQRSNHILRSSSALCDHETGHVHHLPSLSPFANLTSGPSGCETTSNHDMAAPRTLLSPSKLF
ncbi:hypothetical protein O6H91_12G007600 [Diphasiastrum complanatum]|uniref:Uncharacterized protein n=4 Tax=Diphasiastrum complanatum TaxID=34168 RepID=A0ACC2BYL4_DIPCM|nr:hypothetical protein O6H91_12G007600 [Diphasiastrum complanatum]KAJ7534868.1 hypothetical protein O6H91_12G007600 [Diphasiastrum complanatum]KAJ7534869.1 hypothetical protein O6H91_12G007600 [Diphasiastrum complanatum]KAJ7534870.1 hypothetical protein O6H91_12G007600 [Diphasiastrum complanatum]